jgi:hypothetical protein
MEGWENEMQEMIHNVQILIQKMGGMLVVWYISCVLAWTAET